MRSNSHYVVLFNMPVDKTQVKTISRQILWAKYHYMLMAYKHVIFKQHGYLLLNLKINTPASEVLKINIFLNER